MRRSLYSVLFVALVTAATAHAQQADSTMKATTEGSQIGNACKADAHRQFDFWIGEWEVTDSAGKQSGHSRISRAANGCAILEHWQGASGVSGMSLNAYDPANKQWTQEWYGGGGDRLHLKGRLESGSMVLAESRETPKGKIRDRITWTPLPDGRVVQLWDQSTDGGKTWTTSFRGFYKRSSAAPSKVVDSKTPAGPTACVNDKAHRFDFWAGTWDVASRRQDSAGVWQESKNRWNAETVLGGCAFVDYADGNFGTGRLRGMGTRYYNPATDRWYITWMSTEQPGGFETWEGAFKDDGTAEFLTKITAPSGVILSRIRWWDIQQNSAEWEHAISRDNGATWTPTWRMTMTRAI